MSMSPGCGSIESASEFIRTTEDTLVDTMGFNEHYSKDEPRPRHDVSSCERKQNDYFTAF